MKKIFYLLLVVILSSCSDLLDLEPQQSLSPDIAYATLNDCDNAARGMYMRAQGVYGDDYILIADAFADNLISFSQGRGTYSTFRDWSLNSGSNYMWTNPYMVVINCSLLIDNMEIPTEGDDVNSFNQLKGEALALRALMHFELVRQHGKSYQTASDSDLGIPYVRVTNSDNQPARQTVKQNYIDIEKELTDAYALMTAEGASDLKLDNTRLQKFSVAAILAKVYLTMHRYDDAATYAKLAIDGAGANSIASATDFPNVWKDKSEAGVYWKIAVTQKESLKVGDLFNQYLNSTYKSEFVAPNSFVGLYSSSDPRKAAYFSTSSFNGYEAHHVIKYIGDVDDTSITRNKVALKVLRGAEMYLTYAEGLLRGTGSEADAKAALITVLTNRGLYTLSAKDYADGLAGEALLNEVMKQRRLEMFCEWDRYHTIKRLGQDIVRLDGEGELSDGTGRPNVQFVLKADDHRFQFPILSSELDANSNMVQNPGY